MFSAPHPIADIAPRGWHVRFVPILLRKSFVGLAGIALSFLTGTVDAAHS
jgi:hypothetical protein